MPGRRHIDTPINGASSIWSTHLSRWAVRRRHKSAKSPHTCVHIRQNGSLVRYDEFATHPRDGLFRRILRWHGRVCHGPRTLWSQPLRRESNSWIRSSATFLFPEGLDQLHVLSDGGGFSAFSGHDRESCSPIACRYDSKPHLRTLLDRSNDVLGCRNRDGRGLV